jgi:UDP-N-acetylmuramoyl-tripeptide--D-alanyl-D-alanine ligase
LYQYIRQVNGKVFVNADDDLLMQLSNNIARITYGTTQANVTGTLISDIPFIKMHWKRHGKQHTVQSSLFGKYNFYNLLAGITIGTYFNVSSENISQSISSFRPNNNRSEIRETNKGNTLILDAYNANPSSMQQAITAFSQFEASNKVLILGDMFELGKFSTEKHTEILQLVAQSRFNQVLLCGKEFFKLKSQFPGFIFFESTVDLLQYLQHHPLQKQHILIKGSRSMQLEKTAEWL